MRELDLGLLSFRAARWRRCDAGLRQLTLLLRELSAALQEAKTDDEDPYGLRPQTVLRGPSPLELTVPRRVSMLVQQRRSPRPPVARLRPEVDQPPVAVRLSAATRPPVGSSRWQEKVEQLSRVRFPGETLPRQLRVPVALDHALASLPARRKRWMAATKHSHAARRRRGDAASARARARREEELQREERRGRVRGARRSDPLSCG